MFEVKNTHIILQCKCVIVIWSIAMIGGCGHLIVGIYLGLLPQVLLTVLAGDKDSVSVCVCVCECTQIYTAIHRYRVVNNQLFT